MSRIKVKELEALGTADDGRTLREPGGIVERVRAGVRGITVWFRYDTKLNGKKRDYSRLLLMASTRTRPRRQSASGSKQKLKKLFARLNKSVFRA